MILCKNDQKSIKRSKNRNSGSQKHIFSKSRKFGQNQVPNPQNWHKYRKFSQIPWRTHEIPCKPMENPAKTLKSPQIWSKTDKNLKKTIYLAKPFYVSGKKQLTIYRSKIDKNPKIAPKTPKNAKNRKIGQKPIKTPKRPYIWPSLFTFLGKSN